MNLLIFLQEMNSHGAPQLGANVLGHMHTALISKFAGYLNDAHFENSQGILTAFTTALEISNLHDLWVIDSGVKDHMSNKLTNIRDFNPSSFKSFVSVANWKTLLVMEKNQPRFRNYTILCSLHPFFSFSDTLCS